MNSFDSASDNKGANVNSIDPEDGSTPLITSFQVELNQFDAERERKFQIIEVLLANGLLFDSR